MSSFVWMKVLESAPQRYDRGVDLLSGGRIAGAYERIAALSAAPGSRVLDIGCGTGGASFACAARGADVVAIDIDAGMLEVARSKPAPEAGSVTFVELGAAEIEDRYPEQSFDAVVFCLALSEMSPEAQDYALKIAFSRLKPGGTIVVADETLPEDALARFLYRLRRLPLVAATYLMTQTTTRPTRDLGARVRAAGFVDVDEERMWSGAFVIVHGARPT